MSGILSPEEIDALLAEAKARGGTGAAEGVSREEGSHREEGRRPFLEPEFARKLSAACERFAREWAELLGELSGKKAVASLEALEELAMRDFIMSVPEPAIIAVASSGAEGPILELDPSVSFALVDGMLGGTLELPIPGRPHSRIEKALLAEVLIEAFDLLHCDLEGFVAQPPLGRISSVNRGSRALRLIGRREAEALLPACEGVLLAMICLDLGGAKGFANLCLPFRILAPSARGDGARESAAPGDIDSEGAAPGDGAREGASPEGPAEGHTGSAAAKGNSEAPTAFTRELGALRVELLAEIRSLAASLLPFQALAIAPFSLAAAWPPQALAELLGRELPQTAALVLSRLGASAASALLQTLPVSSRIEVAHRVARMGKARPELVRRLDEELLAALAALGPPADPRFEGGILEGAALLARILARSDRATERLVLEGLQAEDPELAAEMGSLIFAFEDIVIMEDCSIRKLLRAAEPRDLSLALRTAGEGLKARFRDNMPPEDYKALGDDWDYTGPVRLREIEEAQRRIIATVRRLEEEGAIPLARRGSPRG